MPAQICHSLFAEDAIRLALGDECESLLSEQGNLFRLAAQGPDVFYHNRRSRPLGLRFGVALHKRNYGSFLRNMILEYRKRTDAQGAKAFILGFATHAILDRVVHPFIDYFSGWVNPADTSTKQYYRCHVFYERILDVFVLKWRRNLPIRDFSLAGMINLDEDFPAGIVKILSGSLQSTYSEFSHFADVGQRIENAYFDSEMFYNYFDNPNHQARQFAISMDKKGPFKRRLALIYPDALPEGVDYLNLEKKEWRHPADPSQVFHSSFFDLYEKALTQAAKLVSELQSVLESDEDPGSIQAHIGDEGLNSTNGQFRSLLVCSPLPLGAILDDMYARVEGRSIV